MKSPLRGEYRYRNQALRVSKIYTGVGNRESLQEPTDIGEKKPSNIFGGMPR